MGASLQWVDMNKIALELIVDGEEFLGSESHGIFLPSKAGNWQYRQ